MKLWKYLSITCMGVLAFLALCAARSQYFPHVTITTAVITDGSITTVDIDGGTIDGTPIGGTTPSSGAFTTITASSSIATSNAIISGGSVNGAPVGAVTPSTGAFTILQAETDPTTGAHVGDRGYNDTRYLRASANLSDLPDVVAARSNLGVTREGYIRGLYVLYKDSDEVYIQGGELHIDDGADDVLLYSTSQIEKAFSGVSESKVYYLYVDCPASGYSIGADDVEYYGTAPVWVQAKHGWYHPTAGDLRFIGSCHVSASNVVTPFQRSEDGHLLVYNADVQILSSGSATSWTDVTDAGTYCSRIDGALALLYGELSGTAGSYTRVRKNGVSEDGYRFGAIAANGFNGTFLRVPVDSGGLVEYKVGSSALDLDVWVSGYWEPR